MHGMTQNNNKFPRSLIDGWLADECLGNAAQSLPQRVAATQFALLAQTLHHAAAHSQFYKKRLAGYNLSPRTVEELRTLPFTTPDDLRNARDWREFLCISQGDVRRIITLQTSGSTGTPKRVAYSNADIERSLIFFCVGMRQLTHSGQNVLILVPGAGRPDGISDVVRQSLIPIGVNIFSGTPIIEEATLRAELLESRPHVVVAAPRQVIALLALLKKDTELAEFLRHKPAQSPYSGIEGIQTSGEILPEPVRQELQNILNCRILDHFGMTETGYAGGVECFAQSGYHLRELDLIVEIINPQTLLPVADGTVGEIVLTTLQREAMPLIRYRTGDAGSMLPAPCPCGSPMRRLAPLCGRYYCNEAGEYAIRNLPKGAN